MERGYIAIEQAARSNDIVVGVMLLCMVAIAVAAWCALAVVVRRNRQKIKRAVERTEKRVREECAEKYDAKGAQTFAEGFAYRKKIRELEGQLQATKDALDGVCAEYKALQEVASACPAYATKGKKGAF